MGQPLIYLFAMVAGAMILIWGIRTVVKMGDTAAAVEIGKFTSKMQSNVDQYLNFDEGSATETKIMLPAKIKYLCFLDSTANKKCMLDGKPCNIEDVDKGLAVIAGTRAKENLFMLPAGAYQFSKKEIENMKVDASAGNPICFRNNQNKKFTLTSMGTYVSVS